MPGPFQVQTRLTAIALAVKPQGFIADMVCPRVDAEAEEFTYTKGITDELFTIPDTSIGRTSRPNTVEFGAKDVTDKVEDHGLQGIVPVRDINRARAQRANWDPMAEATENTGLLVHLAREQRVSNLIFGAANYQSGAAGTLALSGHGQWSDYANSDPLKVINEQMDKMLVRPNAIVFGQSVWTGFRRHPKVVAAIKPSGAGNQEQGSVNRMQVAEELEIDEVHVGRTWYNTKKKGQTAVMGRLWGKHCALLHINRDIKSMRSAMPTFAFTAEWMGFRVGTYEDESIGTDGATIVKLVDQIKELVAWKEAGFLYQNAVA